MEKLLSLHQLIKYKKNIITIEATTAATSAQKSPEDSSGSNISVI